MADALYRSLILDFSSVFEMEESCGGILSKLYRIICDCLRSFLFRVLCIGPIPHHIAFIMDGNRRFARIRNLKPGEGHKVGFLALMSILQYCYELGVKFVTIYVFSIENFKRRPDEVKDIMDLLLEKIEGLLQQESIVNKYGIKVNFFGNLNLLNAPVRMAAEKVMAATAKNTRVVLSICVAYTCTDEIVHAVQESCREKVGKTREDSLECGDASSDLVECDSKGVISVEDLERHMYTAGCPDPDMLVRTSGESRLSNFLLWQSSFCYLIAPRALWPEITLRHLVWAILGYQRVQPYLERKKRS